eukprot:TRINITY_DN3135_c0_g1_i5.p2 TRINITY_DN3135_c0_g1~~TRINITY_DN3135_c0_g1_i5.p2  ORF type:complete len:183 (-),score=37.07 TRINITY_DN3135_c0_g1_i5:741-1235(-)
MQRRKKQRRNSKKEEMEIKERKEKELSKLMKLEQQLIERLKEKQREQFEAFQQLEAALQKRERIHVNQNGSSKYGNRNNYNSDQLEQQEKQVSNGEPSEEEIARTFATYDIEGNGYVRTNQLESLMKDLGLILRPEQVNMAIQQLDRKQQGLVSFGEFLLWWRG